MQSATIALIILKQALRINTTVVEQLEPLCLLQSQFTIVATVPCAINMITTVIEDSRGINYDRSSVTRTTPRGIIYDR